MSEKLNYLECWTHVAASLLPQALIGEPSLSESLPKPMPPGSFGFTATIVGDEEGWFSVSLDGTLVDVRLLGEGIDQKAGWAELLKEIADAAAGELLAKVGRRCQVTGFVESDVERKVSRAFQLKAGEHFWSIQVYDCLKPAKTVKPTRETAVFSSTGQETHRAPPLQERATELSAGLQLLLDVELEASLRFGAREMPLGEILNIGPGDVVQLDRHVNDPVDLIVGDKIVARGDVVLINGNFGLRVTEVAEPQRRLESIRCLF